MTFRLRRPPILLPVVLPVLTLAACGGDPRPPMMSGLPAFDGRLRIESRAGGAVRVLEGDLAFDRATGRVAFRRASDGVRLERAEGTPLRRVVDGVESEPTLADEGDFALLMVVLSSDPDPRAEVVPIDGGYAVRQGANELRVVATPRG